MTKKKSKEKKEKRRNKMVMMKNKTKSSCSRHAIPIRKRVFPPSRTVSYVSFLR